MSDRNGYIELPPIEIKAEADKPSPSGRPGGSSGSGSNWSIGFGGGGAGGFSGGFGGSSRKKAKKRAKARARQRAEAEARARAEAEAQAQAQAQARAREAAEAQARREQAIAAYRQTIESLTQTYQVRKGELDQAYSTKSATLAKLLESDIAAAKKPPNPPGNERWQLYLISKEKSEIDGLIVKKGSELKLRSEQALSFYGYDPLVQGAQEYKGRLDSYGAQNPAQAYEAHSRWEQAYIAAHEKKILSESIRILEEKSKALSVYYAKREIEWRKIEAIHEQRRQYASRREEQIKYKLRTDEEARSQLTEQANTLTLPSVSATGGALVLTSGGTWLAEAFAQTLASAIRSAIATLLIPAGPTVAAAAVALFYSGGLADSTLSAEQRRRQLQGLAVGADVLGLPENADLPAIADAGGSVELQHRIKVVPVANGVELNVVRTGEAFAANVPVINAVLEPLSNTYQAQTPGSPSKRLVFSTSGSPAVSTGPAELHTAVPQAFEGLSGADIQLNDCIVCFPAELGWPPQYFSLESATSASGIVTGNGQSATADWWKGSANDRGAAIPATIGERLRNREFKSVAAFDKALWRAIAEDPVLSKPFDEINKKRMERGFAPYAPKDSWVDDRREFEFRSHEAANDSTLPFNLDHLSITRPNSTHGEILVAPSVMPWPVSSGIWTWTPYVPPGIESLGPTQLPTAPEQPTLYPGATTDPVGSQNETLPAVDPVDAGASIPGYGEDDDLPSPGLVFAGPPVEPLEVGPYNELSGRSRLDGLDIDHIVSRQALKKHILKNNPNIAPWKLAEHLRRAPSIAIPAEVHRRLSETYGGRNTQKKQNEDARNLRDAVDSNVSAIKPGLLEADFSEGEIEAAREKLHELNNTQGWY